MNGSGFKTYYETTVNTTVKYWHKDGQIRHCNRTRSPELDPHVYNQCTTKA